MKLLLLVCVAVMMVFAACGGDNAEQINEQYKLAMMDVKSIGTGLESYITDNYMTPDVTDFDGLSKHLAPFHIKALPMKDPWGNAYLYQKIGQDEYAVGCAGPDGQFGGFEQTGRYTDRAGKDIIFKNGNFTFGPQ
jgi:hypothetical protein